MSIVPASRLSRSDLALLGNNLRSACHDGDGKRRRWKGRRLVAAINRSLAAVDEHVRRLHRRTATAA
jgi:hypothetical protein